MALPHREPEPAPQGRWDELPPEVSAQLASRPGYPAFWRVPARGRSYNRNRTANAGPCGGRARRSLGGSDFRCARLVLG
ncbi:rCG40739 [Rattus norvegicus]|uniref:RCG40739 n=1 Tax=Rattus norvegicus TaxID=10116 RepID=A6KSW4_RAT|nr:rCG40739 [Rattus norvegicus]